MSITNRLGQRIPSPKFVNEPCFAEAESVMLVQVAYDVPLEEYFVASADQVFLQIRESLSRGKEPVEVSLRLGTVECCVLEVGLEAEAKLGAFYPGQ